MTDPKLAQYVKVAALLEQDKTYTEVAAELGIARRTLYRWCRDPAFKAVADDLHDDLCAAASQELRSLVIRAVGVLRKAIDGGQVSTQAIAAAESVLDRCGIDPKVEAPGLGEEETDELMRRAGWVRAPSPEDTVQ